MATGTVKFFNDRKGFGFLIPDEGGKDVFVNKTAVLTAGMTALKVGQRLSFETQIEPRGVTASKLKPQSPDVILSVDDSRERAAVAPSVPQRTSIQGSNQRKPRGSPKTNDTGKNAPEAKTQADMARWRQKYDHYCALAHGADSDLVARENYWQHAEHYIRLLNGSSA